MFSKKKRAKTKLNMEFGIEISDAKFQFEQSMEFIEMIINDKNHSASEKRMLLDYFSSVVKDDMQTEYASALFYQNKITLRRPALPFPDKCYDKEYNIVCECKRIGTKEINLSKDYVITLPWHSERMARQIVARNEDPFTYIESNHRSYYYPSLDLCLVYNGYHSIAAGKYFKQGTIISQIWDIEPLFQHIYTDGVKWYNKSNNLEFSELNDFRFGVLFEIAKAKKELIF